jgi:hypothetical protein
LIYTLSTAGANKQDVKMDDRRRRLANFTYPARTLNGLFLSVPTTAENRKKSSEVAPKRMQFAKNLI